MLKFAGTTESDLIKEKIRNKVKEIMKKNSINTFAEFARIIDMDTQFFYSCINKNLLVSRPKLKKVLDLIEKIEIIFIWENGVKKNVAPNLSHIELIKNKKGF